MLDGMIITIKPQTSLVSRELIYSLVIRNREYEMNLCAIYVNTKVSEWTIFDRKIITEVPKFQTTIKANSISIYVYINILFACFGSFALDVITHYECLSRSAESATIIKLQHERRSATYYHEILVRVRVPRATILSRGDGSWADSY